jgi:hypothetical protein
MPFMVTVDSSYVCIPPSFALAIATSGCLAVDLPLLWLAFCHVGGDPAYRIYLSANRI